MNLQVLPDAAQVAHRAAALIAADARDAVKARGRFTIALSGGRTPWAMLRALDSMDVPWSDIHLVQVDERIAPAGHQDRNLTHLQASLTRRAGTGGPHIYAMPVDAPDIEAAAEQYARTLSEVAGSPAVLDLVHLGLGSDGHTASLIPGDPVLDVTDTDVAVTAPYQGRRRMTLTYSALNRARRVLWVVTGEDKAPMLARLFRGDRTIPAGPVSQEHATVVADQAASRQVAATLPGY